MAARSRSGRTGEAGIALLLVIWVLALLAGLAAQITVDARSGLDLAHGLVETGRARVLADSGIWAAVARLSHADARGTLRLDGSDHTFAELGDSVTVSIRDERAKLNLNAIGELPLRELLRTVGADVGVADQLARAILQHRSAASAAAQRGNSPRPRGFASLAELRQVPGIPANIWRQLSPFLTIYAGGWGINPVTAPPEVLTALPGVEATEARRYVELRRRYIDDPIGLRLVTPLAITRHAVWTKPSVVNITATGRSASGALFVREAVVDLSPNNGRLYRILSWSRAVLDSSGSGGGNS